MNREETNNMKKGNEKVGEQTAGDQDLENLGLDADHSSDNLSVNGRFNADNDRISHNTDGEDDIDFDEGGTEHSPLSEK